MKSKRPRFLASLVCWGLGFASIFATHVMADSPPLSRFEYLEIRMGIPVSIVLYSPSEQLAQQASQAAYHRIRELDRLLSDYDPDSELMKLCKNSRPGVPVKVSHDLFFVLQQAQQLSVDSEGAFDVTVGPLVKLWRTARRNKKLPDQEKLSTARQFVGYNLVKLNASARTVILEKSGMQIDLGAIAKGYAADEALATLKMHGITKAIVEAGGDIALGDPPPGRDYWRVEIEKVRGESGKPMVLQLANQAVATSGDAYQYLEIDGIRYSHLLDPKTGIGMTRPGSVTVIAPNCLSADGLASALTVLGHERGLELLGTRENTHALYLLSPAHSSTTNGVTKFISPGFEAFLLQQQPDSSQN